MPMLHLSFTSNRNLPRAFTEAQQPTDIDTFKIHFISPSDTAGEMRGAKVSVPTCGVTSEGRLRATPPRAPKALPVNRHTVRQQDREDRPRHRVITVRASAESQSHSPSSMQEPHRRIWAVLWSWLSHRKSKETSAGARTCPAHSASLCSEVRYELEGGKTQTAAESPSRKRPTEGDLWSCRETWTQRQRACCRLFHTWIGE